MDYKKTLNNYVMIKLDSENTSIKLKNGLELYIDTSFDKEKHATVTGEIYGLPSHLSYSGEGNKGMPWMTTMDLKFGDHVIIYYMSVINALARESKRYVLEGKDRYIFTEYQNIFAAYGDGFVKPLNGYCLIEPCDDPFVSERRKRLETLGLELVIFNNKSNVNVSFGVVRYLSTPNREYVDDFNTDDGVDIEVGDTVVLRRITDIPLQYGLHAKIDNGKGYLRVQRRNILAKI